MGGPEEGTDQGTDQDSERVYKTQAVKVSWQVQLRDMLIQKGFSTILLCGVIYVLYTDTKSEIPKHIQAIKDGYVTISDADRAAQVAEAQANRVARDQALNRHVEAIKICIEGQRDEREKAREAAAQLERILTNKVGVVAKQVEATEKKIEAIQNN